MSANGIETPGVLKSRDLLVASFVASGLSHPDIARQLKLSVNTVRRTMAKLEVRREVDAIREHVVEAILGQLLSGLESATRELARLVTAGTAADSVKLGAVKLTIDAVLKVREQVTLARQLEEQEAKFAELEKRIQSVRT